MPSKNNRTSYRTQCGAQENKPQYRAIFSKGVGYRGKAEWFDRTDPEDIIKPEKATDYFRNNIRLGGFIF